jgi:serine/threonine-protein kinase SRPK3
MDDSDDESIEDYKIGGYHPVHVGEVFIERYVSIQKLGWGHFSTVWLAKDMLYNTFVALKIQKSASNYMEAAYDEVEILEQVSSYWKKDEWIKSAEKYLAPDFKANMNSCFCVQLLNSFLHAGPNGKHFVMVFEIMGVNLLDIIRRYDYKGIPIPLVRIIAKQILIGLDYLHRICKIIHTDLKPENVLLSLTKEQINEIKEKGQLGKRIKFKYPVHICGKEEEKPIIDPNTGKAITKKELERKKKRREKKKRQKQHKKERKKALKNPIEELQPAEQKEETQKEEVKEKIKEEIKAHIVQQSDKKQGNVQAEDDLVVPKPRSRSLPSMIPSPDTGAYMLDPMMDEFLKEIEEYQQYKAIESHIGMRKMNSVVVRNPINEEVKTKIVDLGNGCWTYHHFTSLIQTRQYRSPEVIIGAGYGTSADIWSFACMIFELITGEFLFEPRKSQSYGKDDDHIAQVIVLLRRR